ncbi:MAG: glycine cleavage system protein H [Dehalococcoidales bacterium]|nr:glycine cleavage system protein H [Dehalococcoidales bacterium]
MIKCLKYCKKEAKLQFMVSDEIKYTTDHLWVKQIQTGLFRIGVTYDYLDRLAAIRLVELPKVGSAISSGDSMAVLESSKAAIELPAPFSGIVKKINADVVADPGLINRLPMTDGWLLEIGTNQPEGLANLLSEEDYQKLL